MGSLCTTTKPIPPTSREGKTLTRGRSSASSSSGLRALGYRAGRVEQIEPGYRTRVITFRLIKNSS
jgi:hypothetical protein